MKLFKIENEIILLRAEQLYRIEEISWDALVNQEELYTYLQTYIETHSSISNSAWLKNKLMDAPIGNQEIWAAGVTYLRSKEARMEESKQSGGSDFYAKVYEADRPELFFKSTASRCVGSGQSVYIRRDSAWNVPEPELTLFANRSGKIVGYTIGNDMSSRDIEGDNPLYLPQAKSYDGSAAIGPCLWIPGRTIDAQTNISMRIERERGVVFSGVISISQMKRTHEELISYLFREMSFPHGVYLMTGTCLVPPNDFTLHPGDKIVIAIDGIGELINTVAKKS